MKRANKGLIPFAVLLLSMSIVPFLLADHVSADKPTRAEVIQKTKKLHMPFIANDGQMDEQIKFYANTFGGTVFVTKDGEIVYSFPGRDAGQETRGRGQESEGSETGYGPRVRDNVIQSKSEILDFFLISCREPISKFISPDTYSTIPPSEIRHPKSETCGERSRTIQNTRTVTLKEEFVCGKISGIKGEGVSVTKVNYFKGNDPSKWKSNIPTYDYVNLGEVYEGIGLRLKAYGNNVEKLFYVKPGANPGQIKILLSEVKDCGIKNPKPEIRNPKLQTNEHGELVVKTEIGTVKFTKPIAYQEIDGKRVEVECGYVISDGGIQETGDGAQGAVDGSLKSEARSQNTESLAANSKLQSPKSEVQNSLTERSRRSQKSEYGFKVASYDKTKDIIIDPLQASTYLGGSSDDAANSIAIDSEGNIYVAGYTVSSDFPTAHGAYDASNNKHSYDAFVSRLSGDLTNLLASTYLGGSDFDEANSIAIDSLGNIYVAGNTKSSDFPATLGAYDILYNDVHDDYNGDVFVSRLNGDLTSLLASTYLGGSYDDPVKSMAIDSLGNIYVAGYTGSYDFPTTSGAYGTSSNNYSYDGFVSRLSGDLTKLAASTYFGGSNPDFVYSIAIDSGGNIYVTGWTASNDFPTTLGAYNNSFSDYYDTFVSKLSGDLTSLLASTYLGWSIDDVSIAIASGGNIYVAGGTWNYDLPTTPGAYDTSSNGYHEGFVSQLNGDLTNLLACTYLGGSHSDSDSVSSIAIDSEGNICVAGVTNSLDFPVTSGADDTSYNGFDDGFVSRLSGDLRSLLASTYLGGSDYDYTNSIAIDSGGNIYVASDTESSDIQTTSGAYDTSYNRGSDGFVSRFDSNLSPAVEVALTIESSPYKIQHSKTVDISGTVTLTPNDKGTQNKFLKKKIKLFRISPNGSYEEIKTTKPFKSGSVLKYKFKDVRLPDVGRWQVYSFYDGGNGFRGTTSETIEIDVQKEQKSVVGYAILIEGYTEDSSNIDAYNLTTNDIYKKLLDKGFIDDNIYYVNSDDTQEGVDEIPDKEKILDAIENWAGKEMNKKAASLYIIFAGPGEKETLFIGSERLTAGDLSKSLKNLEAGLNKEASKKDIVVVLGANRSGSFINDLSRSKRGKHRIIITSADSEEVAYQGPLAPDETVRQGDYFVSEFFRYAAMGMNVKGCYEKAADTIAVFTDNKNGNGLNGAWAGNGNYFDHAAQHPLIDDNGDKVGTSKVSFFYNGDDGERSSKLIVGKGETPSFEFTRVSDVVSLEGGDTTPELFAEISDASEGNKAWIEITPPQFGLENDKESREQQVVDLSRYNSTGFDEESERYTWNSFTSADFEEPGTYGIFYFAQDAETGDITPIVTSDVYKEEDNNDLQGQYLLNLPKDNGTTSVALTFDWTSDGKDPNVTYSLTISESPTFDTVYYQQKGITENNVFVDLSASLLNGTTYYWRVLASDDEGRTKFIERFEDGENEGEGTIRKRVSSVSGEENKKNGFTSETGSFYLIPKIEGYVYDKITGEKIEGVEVVVQKKKGDWKTDPPLKTNEKGHYESFLPNSGKYKISVSISGYAKRKKIIKANSGKKKLVNMEMESQ